MRGIENGVIEKRVTNPFKAGPLLDPAPDTDGVMWPAPHSHVSPVADVFEAIQQALAEARAGNPVLLMTAWMHLTHACFIGGQLALCRRALIELSARIKQAMRDGLADDRPLFLPPWAAKVFHGTCGDVSHEVVEKAFLDDYRAFALTFIATRPTTEHQVADNSLLAVALVTAYIETDEESADALLSDDTDPTQVMAALNHLHDAVVGVIAEISGLSFDEAARSFDNSFLTRDHWRYADESPSSRQD